MLYFQEVREWAIVIRYIIFSGSEGVEALLAPHVGGMVDCLVKLLRAAYHAHLARALTNTGDWRWASAYTDSDEDSVIV